MRNMREFEKNLTFGRTENPIWFFLAENLLWKHSFNSLLCIYVCVCVFQK